MLYNVVEKAKNGDEDAMMELIRKFGSLLHKYANKLEYEDAYQDYVLYFIELVKSGSLENLKDKNDGAVISYINICVQNYYKKKIQVIIKSKKEALISDLSEEQQYYIDVLTARSDNHNPVMDYNTQNILNANENRVIYLSYVEGYSTAEIARMSNRTRQAVNQLKHRALDKLKATLDL